MNSPELESPLSSFFVSFVTVTLDISDKWLSLRLWLGDEGGATSSGFNSFTCLLLAQPIFFVHKNIPCKLVYSKTLMFIILKLSKLWNESINETSALNLDLVDKGKGNHKIREKKKNCGTRTRLILFELSELECAFVSKFSKFQKKIFFLFFRNKPLRKPDQ